MTAASLTQKAEFLSAFERYRTGSAPSDPEIKKETDGDVLRFIGPSLALHDSTVLSPRLLGNRGEMETTVSRQIDYFKQRRRSFEWKVYDFDPGSAGLVAALSGAGFEADHSGTVMFAPSTLDITRGEGVTTVRITERSEFEALADLQSKVWGRDSTEFARALHNEATHPAGRLDVFLASLSARPIACAWVRHYGEISFFFGGSTLPQARGQGAYTALVRERTLAARGRGANFVVSECVPASERVLRHLGFESAGRVTKYNFLLK
ncbi:MAG TPA: hypothetical protein VFV50_14775 [Bdellovibrionales bacterium]|nr:hypothetical protein [Bdellovibrionales bacterium]